jgi:hypothetical protein
MQEVHNGDLVQTETPLSGYTHGRVQSQFQEVVSRRALHEAAAPSPTESQENIGVADTDVTDAFFGWFVLVGMAWCIYRSRRPGGWCRGTSEDVNNQQLATPQAPEAHREVAVGMPAAHWTPSVDSQIGVVVAHVHLGHHHQQPILNAAHHPGVLKVRC